MGLERRYQNGYRPSGPPRTGYLPGKGQKPRRGEKIGGEIGANRRSPCLIDSETLRRLNISIEKEGGWGG